MKTHFKTMAEVEQFLYGLIPKVIVFTFPGDEGVKRTSYYLNLLHNPQNKIRVTHVAGTSGKGSTCYYLSSLLVSSGFNVGLHISPHLVNIKERFQINNVLLKDSTICMYLEEILRIFTSKPHPYSMPTYFEMIVILAYYIFWKEKVDYAVIETGLGGTYDGTNVVSSPDKLCIITRIGHDHTQILGKTLSKIAAQKAGIIQQENTIITLNQHISVRSLLKKVTEEKKGDIIFITKGITYKKSKETEKGVSFVYSYADKNLLVELNTHALYQIENVSLSLTAYIILSQRDKFTIDEKRVKDTLREVVFAGRMQEGKVSNKNIIIDGAHNPQKMRSFILSLVSAYPHEKFDFLIAFKKGKNINLMLRKIKDIAETITITSFFIDKQDIKTLSQNPEIIKKDLEKIGIASNIILNPHEAVKSVLKNAKERIVITGSLYLLGDIYADIIKG